MASARSKRLILARDPLANVTVDGAPIATARIIGGRDFDVISVRARPKSRSNKIVQNPNTMATASGAAVLAWEGQEGSTGTWTRASP